MLLDPIRVSHTHGSLNNLNIESDVILLVQVYDYLLFSKINILNTWTQNDLGLGVDEDFI